MRKGSEGKGKGKGKGREGEGKDPPLLFGQIDPCCQCFLYINGLSVSRYSWVPH